MIPHNLMIINSVEHYSYVAIFLFAIFAGYLVPVPEEIVLLVIGYLASVGIIKMTPAILIVILAFAIGDNILFRFVQKNNKYADKLVHDVLSLKFITKHKVFLDKHMGLTIFFTRFFPYLRFVGPVYAGFMRAKERTFLIFNTIAIAIYAPILIWIGYAFHQYYYQIVEKLTQVRHIIVVLIWIIIGLLITRVVDYLFKKHG